MPRLTPIRPRVFVTPWEDQNGPTLILRIEGLKQPYPVRCAQTGLPCSVTCAAFGMVEEENSDGVLATCLCSRAPFAIGLLLNRRGFDELLAGYKGDSE